MEATQPLVQELVEVYGYAKSEIKTHPRYEELKPRENLKSVFQQIKKSLQRTVIGSTNEPDIAKNILKISFCKIFDERYQNENGFAEFYANSNKPQESSEKIRAIFTRVKINRFEGW